MKERDSKNFKAKVIENTKRPTLHGFIQDSVEAGSKLMTDDFKRYRELKNHFHQFVRHSEGEFVDEQVHISGMESFWSMLKRAHNGTFDKMSVKHLAR